MTIRLYPDINVVHLLRRTWTPAEFDRRARARDVALAVGVHVLYELGRGFISDPNHGEVRAACRFLAEVRSIEFLPQAGDVIRAELMQAVLGVPIVTVLSPINQFATRLELTRLGCGYGDQAATFIARLEASANVISSRIATANRINLRTLRSTATFDAFRCRMLPSGPASLGELATKHRVKTTAGALSRIVAHPSAFPTLTTWLYCQWYLGWISVHKGTVPAKQDDLRHLLESARCDGFVTNDQRLAKITRSTSPSRPPFSWSEFLEMLI